MQQVHREFLETLRESRDSRIRYIISNRHIASSTVQPWSGAIITAAIRTQKHVHVSVVSNEAFANEPTAWPIQGGELVKRVLPSPNPER
jgi:hypothetical protein